MQKFIIEYNIVGIVFGTIIGFGLANWVKEFRESILIPFFVKKFKLEENLGSMVSATVEVVILIVLIYLMYQHIIRPAVSGALDRKEQAVENEREWKNRIANDVSQIKNKLTNGDKHNNIDNDDDTKKNRKCVKPQIIK